MIDEQVFRDAGWSEELIQAAKISAKIGQRQIGVSTHAIKLDQSRLFRESNSVTLNALSAHEFSWPKVQ